MKQLPILVLYLLLPIAFLMKKPFGGFIAPIIVCILLFNRPSQNCHD
ncbi:hypothetical protein [Pelagicoccus enzymogenes]|nr:hypothetical protein [Pelagicoccus enzymogenes]